MAGVFGWPESVTDPAIRAKKDQPRPTSGRLKLYRVALRIYLQPLFSMAMLLPRLLGWPFKLLCLSLYLANRKSWAAKATMVKSQDSDPRCYWFHPKDIGPQDKVVLYFHGGGFTACDVKIYASTMANLAHRAQCSVMFPEYGLSPRFKYPHALHQFLSAYQGLLEKGHAPQHIVFGGDSAGGNLALATLLTCQERGIPLPSGVFLESPITDLTFSGESIRTNWRSDCVLPMTPPFPGLHTWFLGLLYRGKEPAHSPMVSPLFGKLEGFPPLHLSYSHSEILRDDSIRLLGKAHQQGVEVTSLSFPNTPHANFMFAPTYPEAKEAFDSHVAFVRRCLGFPASS